MLVQECTYSCFGLSVSSEMPLPELAVEAVGSVSVTIRYGAIEDAPTETYPADVPHCRSWPVDDGVVIEWQDAGRFLVRSGCEIVIDRVLECPQEHLRLIVLGPAMAILLHQRKSLVLHGSAVMIDDRAVLFIGGKCYGKSTMAAALLARGHQVLTDDVIAIMPGSDGPPSVLPLSPTIKLWPDAAEALGYNLADLPKVANIFEKRELIIDSGVKGDIRLSAIYSLGLGDTMAAIPVPPAKAILDLIRHSYAFRFGTPVARIGQADHFRTCARVLECVPAFRLERPNSLELVARSAEFVEGHARSLCR